jgi:hypothetical protein
VTDSRNLRRVDWLPFDWTEGLAFPRQRSSQSGYGASTATMMTLLKPLSAVILDMDGTLHDTEGVYHHALKEAVRAVDFTVTDAFCHSLIGILGPESDAC